MTTDTRMMRAADAILGKAFDAILSDGQAAIVRVSSIDPERKTAVLFVVECERPSVTARRLTYDLATLGRMIRMEWTESERM